MRDYLTRTPGIGTFGDTRPVLRQIVEQSRDDRGCPLENRNCFFKAEVHFYVSVSAFLRMIRSPTAVNYFTGTAVSFGAQAPRFPRFGARMNARLLTLLAVATLISPMPAAMAQAT